MTIYQRWMRRLIDYLMEERAPEGLPVCNFQRIRTELIPGDVILVEGRSRIAEVIKTITQSTWSHAALFVGRLNDIRDAALRRQVAAHYEGELDEPLLIEALLGKGTVVTPLQAYRDDHLRICRPHGLSDRDRDRVVLYAIARLGFDYDIRQVLDLGRFLLPYSIIPRRWHSSLFVHNAGEVATTVCSTMLADAFGSVDYPILPIIKRDAQGNLKLFRRNTRLTMPRDFDHSPYFWVVKYPLLGEADGYRTLPWDTEGWICNGARECYPPGTEILTQEQAWRPAHWAEGQMRSWWQETLLHLPYMERPPWLALHWDDNDEGGWSRVLHWLHRTQHQLRDSVQGQRGGKEKQSVK
ncbi:hypothetical protein Mmc1_3559 [Magnetococcus marinus MC-1]|uniref:Permuted papain-like amidase enzyme, YaeF/YiiX, C92 family n=1 Tax=Magnetococcus marinus (strain ATCC BAA-1437 / JCM 17883 / MC-1) TaxID=156889 RepID=A0LDK1_MAGMM|nr:YiiX/YebB-like N1pC/P60 family cysteine hydrolase [Magnetococcus marinus]ABK46044.1 hypothetical protein Mmc1_3559 [Magnetococcus marinus MC-1]